MNLQVIKDEDALYSLLLRGSNDHLEELLGAKNGEYKILKHTLKPKKNKKIISFSVYGENAIYLKGAESNIDEAKSIYPDWICRFYCTKDIENLNLLLQDERCEVVVMESKIWPMYWRYFATDDPLVDVMISRDSDSIVGQKEKYAVEDWLSKREKFHTIHDFDSPRAHVNPVMGGLWGLKCKEFNCMTNLINLYAKTFDYVYDYSADQSFLSNHILPLYKKDCIDHSSHKDIVWEHTIPFPRKCNNKYGGFVGDRVSPFQTGKINVYSHSKESDKIYLFCHQSQSDFKSCNALIRHLAEEYKEIIIPSKHSNLVSKMIEDVPNIKVLPIVDDNQGMKFYIDIYKNKYKFIGLGLLSEDSSTFDISNPIESFYKQFNLNKKALDEKYNL
tara:strand:+ start:6165 stop:7331 length:1167 start_codon:yes stop_codon:yes gene_type:complete